MHIRIKTVICSVLAVTLAASPALGARRQTTRVSEAAAFRQMAAAIPLGSRVKLQTGTGRRMTATLMAVNDDTIVVQRASRVPEPAMTIPLTDLVRLQRDAKGGLSFGQAVGIGLAAGAGAILMLFGIALTI